MNKEIVPSKSFQDRMKDRIKDSIGELMTDDELKKVVNQAVQEIFFEKQVLQDGYGTKEKPPWIHKLIKEILKDKVRIAVDDYMFVNSEIILKNIDNIVKDGVGGAVLSAITNRFQFDLNSFQMNIEAQLSQQ